MITKGFTFDLNDLQRTEGFPEEAKRMVESQGGRLDMKPDQQRKEIRDLKNWTTQAYGMFAEYKVTNMLKRVFYSEPCTLINSFKENQLVIIAKEALDPGNTKGPLSPEVRNIHQKILNCIFFSQAKALWSVLCQQNIEKIQEQVFTWLGNRTTTEGRIQKKDLESAVVELLEMKKIDDILPSCFSKRNVEGFQTNLKQKGQSLTKE